MYFSEKRQMINSLKVASAAFNFEISSFPLAKQQVEKLIIIENLLGMGIDQQRIDNTASWTQSTTLRMYSVFNLILEALTIEKLMSESLGLIFDVKRAYDRTLSTIKLEYEVSLITGIHF